MHVEGGVGKHILLRHRRIERDAKGRLLVDRKKWRPCMILHSHPVVLEELRWCVESKTCPLNGTTEQAFERGLSVEGILFCIEHDYELTGDDLSAFIARYKRKDVFDALPDHPWRSSDLIESACVFDCVWMLAKAEREPGFAHKFWNCIVISAAAPDCLRWALQRQIPFTKIKSKCAKMLFHLWKYRKNSCFEFDKLYAVLYGWAREWDIVDSLPSKKAHDEDWETWRDSFIHPPPSSLNTSRSDQP